MDHTDVARSFGAAADVYESGRPAYPDAAVAWMLAPVVGTGDPPRVADVGAGTGKLTRRLVAAGCDVVAIDPDVAMLAAFGEHVAGVPAREGTAESLPLEDGSLDAVVLGQAWHWVDVVAASREIGRVLRPGGVLGLVWNLRDGSTPWVARLNALMPGGPVQGMLAAGPPPVAAPLGPPEEDSWRWERGITRAEIGAMARSRSGYLTGTSAVRAGVDRDLDVLCDDLGLDGSSTVALPYLTRAWRSVRP